MWVARKKKHGTGMKVIGIVYYLPKKNLPAHFEQLLFNDSSNFKKIGDQIEALQISELVVQTASL